MAEKMNLELVLELVDQSTRQSQKVFKQLEKIDKQVKKLDKNQKKMNNNAVKGTKKMSNAMKGLNKNVGVLSNKFAALAAGGALTGVFIAGTRSALDFEQRMAEVSTLTDLSAREFNKNFTRIVEDTQKAFGKDQQDVIKALYDGISAGVPATQEASRKFLDAVGKMSIAGVTDMKVAGDAITTVTNAWKKSGITFEQASNTMFGAVRAGKTTMAELAAGIGQVATISAQSGTSIEETFAAIAALTSVGVKTPQAMTQIRGALKALIAPAEESKKVFAALGIKSIGGLMASFKKNKFVNTLETIDKKLKKNTRSTAEYREKLKKIFPDVEGFQAVMALTGNAQDKFNQALEDTNRNAGQTAEAFEKMQTANLEYEKALQHLQIAGKRIGSVLVPHLSKSAKWLAEIFDNLQGIVDNAAHIEQLNRIEKQEEQLKGFARSRVFQERPVMENIKSLIQGDSPERKALEQKYYQEERAKLEEKGQLLEINVNLSSSDLLPQNEKALQKVAEPLATKISEKVNRKARVRLNGGR